MEKVLFIIFSFILLSGCSYDTSEYENAYDDGYKEGLEAGKLESENYYEDIIFSKEIDKYKEGYNDALEQVQDRIIFSDEEYEEIKDIESFCP